MRAFESAAKDTPYDLTVHTGGDTVPVAGPTPELSWKLPLTVNQQAAFELEAVLGSEEVRITAEGPNHLFIEWPWRDLNSSEQVRWRVRVRGSSPAGDWTNWSPWSRFEAGLFESDWNGVWITSPSDTDRALGDRPAFDFSSQFHLASRPDRARLYASALGVYDAIVNGRRVGNTELMPGSESYDRTLYAQAIDISNELREGDNSVVLRLSDGWFRGRTGTFRTQAQWGTKTAVRAEVHVWTSESVRVLTVTDESWQVEEGEVIQADLMDGQRSDFTRPHRSLGAAVASQLNPPPVTWSPAPPVRVTEELAPVSINTLSDDHTVVDFGQNASGRIRLTSLGVAGAETRMVFGEHLDADGHVTLRHLDAPIPTGGVVPFVQEDSVVADGQQTEFEPHHTVHGFQYVEVKRENLHLAPEDLTMQVMHTDFREVGSFACSIPDLNRLWDVARWSFRGNAVDVPTDCPTRERAGWTGDWQIFLPTAERLYDVDGFSRKWLQAVRDDQLDDGRIVNISPDHGRLRTIPDPGVDFATGSAGWGDAVVLVPWELYQSYGDVRVLAETWDAMERWIAFVLNAAAENRHPDRVARSAEPLPHERYIWDGTFHFGEWLEPTPIAEDGTPGPTMPDPMAWAMADKGEVGTAYLYRSLATVAQVAGVLGRTNDADRYSAAATAALDAWRREFLDADGRTASNSQAGYVRALAFGLVPETLRSRAAQHLVELIDAADGHLATGFLSTADLLPVLADAGYPDRAEQLLMQRTSPSWLGMLDRGATTIWEEWEGVDRNGQAHASLNHYSKGAVIRFLHSHVLGLQPAENAVAWNSFVVAPLVLAGLTWARGAFDSPQGVIDVAWRIDAEDAILTVSVPGGTHARLSWGGHDSDVGPGHHELRVPAALVSPSTISTSA